ncbi:MAG: MFS transporter [Kiritimatiellia bacterium]|nr:MFS transporter [Lentisphaerota bacterium]
MSWKRTFIFAFIAQFFGILGFSFATPFLPFFVADLGMADPGRQALWAGVALSSGGLTFAIFAPVWGIMADRYGRKPMVCRAMFGGAVAIFLMSFSQTVPQLIMFRIFQGAFSGTIAASIALVAGVVPLRRSGFALGMMQAAVFIGNAIGPFCGGLAADAFGYRNSFRIGACLTLLAGLLTLFGTREHFAPPDKQTAGRNPGFWKILMLPGFLLSAGILFSVRLSNSISNPSFPLIVRDMVDSLTALNSITGSVIGAAAVAAAGSAAILGYIGDRIGRRRVLLGCCLGAAVASVGHYFADSIAFLFFVRILFGFTVAGMLPAGNAMIQSIVSKGSIGKAYGLATSLSMLGTAIGPTLGGFLAMQAGVRIPFLVTAAGQLCLAALILRFLDDPIRPPVNINDKASTQ